MFTDERLITTPMPTPSITQQTGKQPILEIGNGQGNNVFLASKFPSFVDIFIIVRYICVAIVLVMVQNRIPHGDRLISFEFPLK